ncbi:unnamed protein product [Sphacelaria rigidula]
MGELVLTAGDDDYDDDCNHDHGDAAGKSAATRNEHTTRAQRRHGTNGGSERTEAESVETEASPSSDATEENTDGSGVCGEIERSSGTGRSSRKGSSSKSGSTVVPAEGALREQRRAREARERERAINSALEKLRESLFEEATRHGKPSKREEAVDAALDQARVAPLSMQAGFRIGAGRVESLLVGDGPQPVGEWEVKHALRQGEHELRGKQLASRERIEELLVTVRQESAGLLPPCGRVGIGISDGDGVQRQIEMSVLKSPFGETEHFPPGENLDSFFKLKSPQTIPSSSSNHHGCRSQENSVGNFMTTIPSTSPETYEYENLNHVHHHGAEGGGSDEGASCSANSSGSAVEEVAVVAIESPSPLSPTIKKKWEKQGISRRRRGRDKPENTKNQVAVSVSPHIAALFRAPLLMDVPSASARPKIRRVAAAAAAAVVAGSGRAGRTRPDYLQ